MHSRPSPRALGSALRGREPRASPRAVVIADDQGVAVHHGTLEARVGAGVFAHLLAQISGVQVGGQAIKADPETLPRRPTSASTKAAWPQDLNRREVTHKGEAGPHD
jgi:hypothetical protein